MQPQTESSGISSPVRATGQVSFIQIAATVLRNWRIMVVVPVVLALIVGIVTLNRDREYAVTASFVPQSAAARPVGGPAALAQQFGVSLGERAGDSPEFYVDLLRSRTLLRQVVESEYELPGTASRTLIEIYEIEEGDDAAPSWRQAMNQLRRNLSTSVETTGVVELEVAAFHPILAEQIASRMLELLNAFNMDVRQARAQEEGRFIASRVEQAHAELLAAEAGLQEFLTQNRIFQRSPELIFEHERLERQVAIRQDVYTSLLRAHEESRIDALRDTPTFTIIDHPAGSATPQPRGTVIRTLLAFLLGLIIAMLFAFVAEYLRMSRDTDPEYEELERLSSAAWQDITRPRLWLKRRAAPKNL